MFKNLNKIFSDNNKWILAVVVLILLFLLYSYSQTKGGIVDRMSDGYGAGGAAGNNYVPQTPPVNTNNVAVNKPSSSSNFSESSSNNNYNLQPVANPSELLPKDKNSEWASLNPVGSGDGIQTPDLLQSGYHIGIDTIGQTLKNPSYDLRSDPIIEKKFVSPWNMSTIEPDLARVPLEVGYGCR